MKTISYIQHLHKAIFIALLILALVACDDPGVNGPGNGGGGGDGGGGDPGGTPNIELRYPGDSSEQIKTYANGRDGRQRVKVFSFTETRIGAGGLETRLANFNTDNTYLDQLEEVLLGNAMRASEAQKEALRDLTMATFPLSLFRGTTKLRLFSTTEANLRQQLKLLYNEATGEVKFSIKVEERPLVGNPVLTGHPDFPLDDEDTDPRRWSQDELMAEQYRIQFTSGAGAAPDLPANDI